MTTNVTVFYVGSSLLAPLRQAEAEIAPLPALFGQRLTTSARPLTK